MMKMRLDYAEGFLTKGYAGGYRTHSCHDDLLVVEDLEDYQGVGYLGTRLSNGKLLADTQGYVVFNRVTPVINKDTRFTFS
jgi:hypothetical protein